MSDTNVASICLADNGRYALTWDKAGDVRLWDLKKGRCLDTRPGACLAGDGRVAVSGGPGVVIWDLNAGRVRHDLGGTATRIEAICLSLNGRFALSGGVDPGVPVPGQRQEVKHLVQVWDLEHGRRLRAMEVPAGPISAVALSADARLALTGDERGSIHVWDLDTGRRLRTLTGHEGAVTSIILSPDGRLALSGEHVPFVMVRLTVRVWELASGRCLSTIEEGLCLPYEGAEALTGDVRGRVRAWAAPREPYVSSFHLCRPAAHAELTRLQSRVDTLVREAEQAMDAQRWLAAKALLEQARGTRGFERASPVLDAWRRLTCSARRTGIRAAWPATGLQGHRGAVESVCVSAEGRFALTAGAGDPAIRIWDLESGRCLRAIEGHTYGVASVRLSADDRLVVSGGASRQDGWPATEDPDNTIRVWELETGRCLHVLRGHPYSVDSIDISADGRFAMSAARWDTAVRMWDLTTGRCLRTTEAHAYSARSVALSPDGRLAVSGGEDATGDEHDSMVRVWDLESGRCLHVLRGHTSAGVGFGVQPVCVSSDARIALSAGQLDTTVRVWDLTTGRCLRILEGIRSTSLCLSADGRYALTAAERQDAVQVWDLRSGRCVRSLDVFEARVRSVSLSADGRYALAGLADGTVRVWELDWELDVREAADWDEGARPHLTSFLTRHTPFAAPPPDAGGQDEAPRLAWRGTPRWDEADVRRLLRELGHAGYGWLRPAGVRAELERMAQGWQGPPPLPGS